MTPEIKQMKTWTEAERWLAKHGWGIEQIREQKELWDSTKKEVTASKPEPKTIISKPEPKTIISKPEPKPITKIDNKTSVE